MRLVVTREDYFTAALDVLARDGHAALKIGALCRAIGVTTGSFYHYFGSWDGFVGELLAHWEQEKTQRIFELAAAQPDPVSRVRTIKSLAVGLPHEAETAIRAWSHTNPMVAEVQQRVDAERLDAVRTVLQGVLGDRREADRLAVMGISLLVGMQLWRAPVDGRDLATVLDDFEGLVLDRAGLLAS